MMRTTNIYRFEPRTRLFVENLEVRTQPAMMDMMGLMVDMPALNLAGLQLMGNGSQGPLGTIPAAAQPGVDSTGGALNPAIGPAASPAGETGSPFSNPTTSSLPNNGTSSATSPIGQTQPISSPASNSNSGSSLPTNGTVPGTEPGSFAPGKNAEVLPTSPGLNGRSNQATPAILLPVGSDVTSPPFSGIATSASPFNALTSVFAETSLQPTSYTNPLLTIVGVTGVEIEVAPAPRSVDGETLVPGRAPEIAPAPRESAPPEAVTEAAAPTTRVAEGDLQSTATPGTELVTAAPVPETLSENWGWVGATAAAVVAGGYWLLHRARIVRQSNITPRWNSKALPVGTIFSSDLQAA